MRRSDYSIVINSSDGFQDCWEPFFRLFKKYWPECSAPIFLNTENTDWAFPGIGLVCTQVQMKAKTERRLTWSECLISALNQVETPLVLYFQEDYFLHQPVLHDRVMAAVALMTAHPEVRHIGLTQHGSAGPFSEYSRPGLQVIGSKARYRISTQAGLWRVDTLMSYLEACENGWMFEIYGTWRAHQRAECFLTAKFDASNGGPPIHYLHTGIIKGQWLPEIQKVFSDNDIAVDFSQRGFYRPKNMLARKCETASRLLQDPLYFFKQLYSLKTS